MTCRFGLEEKDIHAIAGVLARYPQVEKAVLYGSRAKGNYKPGSDIDLTLQGGDTLTLTTLYHIMEELDDLLLPYTMDLSIHARINDPSMIEHIQRVGVAFYERDGADPATS